jgi:serine/threonine protein kinase
MQGYQLDPIPLGSGEFGTAFKGIDVESGKEVCLKFSNDVFDEETRIQMEKEAEIMSQIHHANIIAFIKTFWNNRKFCVVMELADGDLREKVQEGLSEIGIVGILIQILSGLKYLHSKKIVHLDLKPENILLKKGHVKIAVFGFAQTLDKKMVSQLTFVRTFPFMAPEMFSNEERRISCDIWSVGVIAYLLATKKFPFKAENQETLPNLILMSQPDPIGKQFSKKTNIIIMMMLNKNA